MKLTILLTLPFLIFSCSNTPNKEISYLSNNEIKKLTEISMVQKSAFDALNTLQISSDNKNRLYSTFANIDQPCYPADTTFTLSQSEFLIAMKLFVSKHFKNLTEEKQEILAEASVKAQEEYQVLICNYNSKNSTIVNEISMTGSWILPNVLGRRDIILVW